MIDAHEAHERASEHVLELVLLADEDADQRPATVVSGKLLMVELQLDNTSIEPERTLLADTAHICDT